MILTLRHTQLLPHPAPTTLPKERAFQWAIWKSAFFCACAHPRFNALFLMGLFLCFGGNGPFMPIWNGPFVASLNGASVGFSMALQTPIRSSRDCDTFADCRFAVERLPHNKEVQPGSELESCHNIHSPSWHEDHESLNATITGHDERKCSPMLHGSN